MTYTKTGGASGTDTPVRAALARVARGYFVSIEEVSSHEAEIPMFLTAPVYEESSFGLVWLEASDLEDLLEMTPAALL